MDEFEFHDVAAEHPAIVARLSSILDTEMADMVEPVNLLQIPGEPAANPNNFNGAWMPWLWWSRDIPLITWQLWTLLL